MFVSIIILHIVFAMLDTNHFACQFGRKTRPMSNYTTPCGNMISLKGLCFHGDFYIYYFMAQHCAKTI